MNTAGRSIQQGQWRRHSLHRRLSSWCGAAEFLEVVDGQDDMMPVRANQATMWTLSADRKTVRLALPPLQIAGMPEPLDVYMDFDAKTVDAMLERLSVLRSQMLPPLPAPGKRN